MIYEIRTYTMRTGAVPEFEERYEKRFAVAGEALALGSLFGTPSSARSTRSSTSIPMTICSTAHGARGAGARSRSGMRFLAVRTRLPPRKLRS